MVASNRYEHNLFRRYKKANLLGIYMKKILISNINIMLQFILECSV